MHDSDVSWDIRFTFALNTSENRSYLCLNDAAKNGYYFESDGPGYVACAGGARHATSSKREAMKFIVRSYLCDKMEPLVRIGKTGLACSV